jgi:acetyl-CoA synthetase (ADP-forming)
MPVAMEKAKEIVNKAMALKRSLLEPEAKEILDSIGIPTPASGIAKGLEEAKGIAESIGYPVVLKVISPQIIHKTDYGGVIVGVKNKLELKRDYSRIIENIKRNAPEAEVIGILIEKMVSPSTEVIIGGLRDSQFGPAIMFGLGGIFTEILKDVSFRLAPITKEEGLSMMEELKGHPLLIGYRGSKPIDRKSLSNAIVAISMLIAEIEEIQEIDLNPVFVYPEGIAAVDARIILRQNRNPKILKRMEVLMKKDKEKVILHFMDGRITRGHIKTINLGRNTIPIKTNEGEKRFKFSELKAIYFVKTFKGDRTYMEKKAYKKVYGLKKPKGKKVLVKFKDGEFLTGFLEGPIPWKKGFFLTPPDPSLKGFFLLPTDERSNNKRIFVINASIQEVIAIEKRYKT